MTLIEVLVVIVLVGMAAAGTTMSLGALTRTNLRSAGMRIIAASRFAYHRAIVQGTTVRIVFDFEKDTLTIEEAEGVVALARTGDPRGGGRSENDEAGVDPWAAAKAKLATPMKPTLGRSPFGPIRGRGGATLAQYNARPLGNGIEVRRLYVPHELGAREQGKGAIYFFPSGMTQNAVVQIESSRGDVYSIELHPLTGRAVVHDSAFEPAVLGDDAFADLEDRG